MGIASDMFFRSGRFPHQRLLLARLLGVVMLFAALAPVGSRWLQHLQLEVVELCTVHGIEQVPVAASGGGQPAKPAIVADEVCPFCSPGYSPLAFPVAAAPTAQPPLPLLQRINPSVAAPVLPRLAHSGAQPRAPPRLV